MDIARQLNVSGRSKMRKDELVKAIERAKQQQPRCSPPALSALIERRHHLRGCGKRRRIRLIVRVVTATRAEAVEAVPSK